MNWNKLHTLNKSLLDLPNNNKSLRLLYEELLLDTIYLLCYFCLSFYFFCCRFTESYWQLILMAAYLIYEFMY